MKREIKFRGKRIDDGKWVHGSYTSMREKNRNNPFCQVESKIFHRIWQWEDGDWNMGGYANYEVIPETVGQYTGLKDKNGIKVFEGDILKITDIPNGYPPSGLVIVTWGKKANGWKLKCSIDDKWVKLKYYSLPLSINMEVIGNIIDNPELINNKVIEL